MTEVKGTKTFIDSLVLNTVQKSAVLYNEGPQLIFAGAGTGKTRVLTAKIAYLVKEKGENPSAIFAATFTNKAAGEMRERVEKFINTPCTGLWIGTFHSLCCRILRRESAFSGYPSSFTIYDAADQLSCVKNLMKKLSIDERTMQPKQILSAISKFKNACRAPADCDPATVYDREIVNLYAAYQKELFQAKAMDFDDLIMQTVLMFRKHPDLLQSYQNRFSYILVDEYQDTNRAQAHLILLLAGRHHRIAVVGDDDQSIYSWRGALVENILSFDKEFSGARVFKLEQNYRSSPEVLLFANAVICHNTNRADKKLWTSRGKGAAVSVYSFRDDRHEAERIVQEIETRIQKKEDPSRIAILFRTNAQSRLFEEMLRKKNIPYIVVGGMSFYDRKEIKDALAYLRLLINPFDAVSAERILNVPPRGIGEKTLEKIFSVAAQTGKSILDSIGLAITADTASRSKKGLLELVDIFSLLRERLELKIPASEMLTEMLDVTGYLDFLKKENTEESQARVENINELVNAVTHWNDENPGKEMEEYLQEISLASDIDLVDDSKKAVNLMTLHTAKGLEFSSVFVVGVEDGLLPSRQNIDEEWKLEEERRLFYVGATRAIDYLCCSYSRVRMRFGSVLPMDPSRFLNDIDPQTFEFRDESMIWTTMERPMKQMVQDPAVLRRPSQLPQKMPVSAKIAPQDDITQDDVQFRVGQQVQHATLGNGTITALSGFGPDLRLTINFQQVGKKNLLARFANLKTQ